MRSVPMGRTRLKVLLAILSADGLPPTYREMAKASRTQVNAILGHVKALRRDGWLAEQESRGAGRTLTAKCRFIPADQL